MPALLSSAIWLWKRRQKPQSMSVKTVTVIFGFGGENMIMSLSDAAASALARAVLRRSAVRFCLRVEVVEVAAEQVFAVAADVGDQAAHRDLVEARDGDARDVLGPGAVHLRDHPRAHVGGIGALAAGAGLGGCLSWANAGVASAQQSAADASSRAKTRAGRMRSIRAGRSCLAPLRQRGRPRVQTSAAESSRACSAGSRPRSAQPRGWCWACRSFRRSRATWV